MWKKSQAATDFWHRQQLKNTQATTTAQLREAVVRTIGDISGLEAGRLSQSYEVKHTFVDKNILIIFSRNLYNVINYF